MSHSSSILRKIIPVLAIAVLPLGVSLVHGEVLFEENFNNGGGGFAKGLIGKKQVELAKGKGPDGSDAVKVSYVGYSRGSERIVMGSPLKKGVTSATLTFDVMFDEDFQWVLGGKLHGLAPNNSITGGEKRSPDGWSARIMFKENGRCAYYLYDQDPSMTWGREKTAGRSAFKKGQWQAVTLKVTLNDPGKKNGSARILIDGREISNARNIAFRGVDGPKTLITQFLFSTFHGGHTPRYAPVGKDKKFTTVYAYYDNFKVVEGVE